MLWGWPHPNPGRIENASKTCVKAISPKQPIPRACNAGLSPRRVKKSAAQTLRKTQAAANAKRPFRNEALIGRDAV